MPDQSPKLFYSLLANVRDAQVIVAASPEKNYLYLFKYFKEQLGQTEEQVAEEFELEDNPSCLVAFEGNKLLILSKTQLRRRIVRPRWDLSVTDEPDIPKTVESDLDISADYLEKSLAQKSIGLLAFFSVSDHLEVLDYARGTSRRVLVTGLGSEIQRHSFVRLVPFSTHAVIAKNGL